MESESSNSIVGDHVAAYVEKIYTENITGNSTSIVENPTAYIEKIYGDNLLRLQRFAVKQGCSPAEAEDVVNEAFCNFLTSMEKHGWEERIEKPFSFLAKIVAHLIFDNRKREKPNKIVRLDDENNFIEPSDQGSAVSQMHLDLDDREIFFKRIHGYTEGFSVYEIKLLWLIYVDNCKPAEISEVLNQSYEKTSIDCNRVKAKLRARMKKNVRTFGTSDAV